MSPIAPQETAPAPPHPSRKRWWQRSPSPSSPRDLAEALFLEYRPTLEKAATRVARRAGFPPQEVEDFVSIATLAMIEDDYARIRKHEGRSTLSTYLVTVVHNLFKDHLNHRFGKFRPSKAAKRLGPVALALERLLILDRLDLDSAIEILVRNHGVEESREELEALAEALPERHRRRIVDDDGLEQRPDPSPTVAPDQSLADEDRAERADEVEQALARALDALDPQDRLILRMCYRDDCAIATVARSLGLVQRSLYSRRDKSFRTLRASLEAEGITWETVQDLLGWSGAEIRVGIETSSENDPSAVPSAVNGDRGPSNRNGS